jgi:hypothetical protein
MNKEELSFLYDMTYGLSVLELGSMIGQSSFVIAHSAESLICVDAWIDGCPFLERRQAEQYTLSDMSRRFDENMAGFSNVKKVRAFTHEVPTLIEERVDVVLVDADHSFEAVVKDIKIAKAMLKPSGTKLILLHDYKSPVWTGVEQAAAQELGEFYRAGTHNLAGFFL